MHEKVIFAPVWLNAAIHGTGPRVSEGGFGLIAGYIFSAPYEDLALKGR
jgi:peptide/nickel transport system substrate-binding protein